MPRIAAINQDKGIAPDRSKGAAVHLVAMRDAFTRIGATVEALDIPDDQQLLATLKSQSRHQPFDMLYERYAIGKSTGARFSSNHGVPLVLEVNAPLADEQKMFRGGAESEEDRENDHFLFSQASCIVAVSSQVAAYAVTRGASPDAIMVCPNGIDADRFNLQVDASPVRQQLLPPDHFVLGFHGRVRPWHGFARLTSVFNRLIHKGLATHLLVVGEGDFEELDHLPPESYTRVGWQPHANMPAYVAAFDALPLTYQPDMPCYFSPLKLMEAMACGVVPLVPDLGDLATIVDHGKTGLVYTAGDDSGLESMLADLIENKDKRRTMGHRAAEMARGHSWTAIAEKIMERVFTASRQATGGGH